MNTALFTGELVRLTVEEPQVAAEAAIQWGRNSEYMRLLDSFPARQWSTKKVQGWVEKEQDQPQPDLFTFGIRTKGEDRLIGGISLDGVKWTHGESFLGIGLGDRQDWGKGYGTDAMRVILRYAFTELNLQRISLDVYAYNPRAIRAYEKIGFVHEGRTRNNLNREGKRWDTIYMGILKEEWEKSLLSTPRVGEG